MRKAHVYFRFTLISTCERGAGTNLNGNPRDSEGRSIMKTTNLFMLTVCTRSALPNDISENLEVHSVRTNQQQKSIEIHVSFERRNVSGVSAVGDC